MSAPPFAWVLGVPLEYRVFVFVYSCLSCFFNFIVVLSRILNGALCPFFGKVLVR